MFELFSPPFYWGNESYFDEHIFQDALVQPPTSKLSGGKMDPDGRCNFLLKMGIFQPAMLSWEPNPPYATPPGNKALIRPN